MRHIPHPSSVFLRKSAFVRMCFWVALVPVALFTPLGKAVLFVSFLSLYANFATDFTNWQAARVEVKQDVISGEIDVEGKNVEVDVQESRNSPG